MTRWAFLAGCSLASISTFKGLDFSTNSNPRKGRKVDGEPSNLGRGAGLEVPGAGCLARSPQTAHSPSAPRLPTLPAIQVKPREAALPEGSCSRSPGPPRLGGWESRVARSGRREGSAGAAPRGMPDRRARARGAQASLALPREEPTPPD